MVYKYGGGGECALSFVLGLSFVRGWHPLMPFSMKFIDYHRYVYILNLSSWGTKN